METIEAIMTRKSVRNFTEQIIDDEQIEILLKAGMSGPSCANTQDWAFIVIKDKVLLNKMADANGKPAEPLRKANIGILICGDLDRAFSGAKEYWIIDGAIATQNITIAAHGLGLGSVWLGTYPQMDRVSKQAKLLDLPDNIIPHSILALGYPQEIQPKQPKIKFDKDKVHFEKW